MGSPLSVIAAGPTPVKIDPGLALQRRIQMGEIQAQQQERLAQAQTLQAQAQERQRQIANQQAMTRAYVDAEGDPEKTVGLAAQYGADADAIQKYQAAHEALVKSRLESSKAENELAAQHHEEARGGIVTILGLPEDQRAQAYQTWRNRDAKQYLPPKEWAQLPSAYTDPTQLQMLNGMFGHGKAIAEEALNQQRAQTEATRARTESSKEQRESEAQKRAQGLAAASSVSDEASRQLWNKTYGSVLPEAPSTFEPQAWRKFVNESVPAQDRTKVEIEQNQLDAMRSSTPQTRSAMIDSIVPPGPLNQRTKMQVEQAVKAGMPPAAIQAIIKDASDQLGRTETAVKTAQAEAPVKIATAVAQARAMNGTGPTANVPPHLAPVAISAYDKSAQALATAQTAAEEVQKVLDLAGSGNKAAGANVPLVGVGALNAVNGIKRINSAEIHQYGTAGSLLDKIQGKLQGWTEGQPIPADVLKDMKTLHDSLAEGASTKHEREVQAINQSYGSSFTPMKFEAAKPAAQKIRARDPQGKLHEAPAGTPLPAGWKLEK